MFRAADRNFTVQNASPVFTATWNPVTRGPVWKDQATAVADRADSTQRALRKTCPVHCDLPARP